MNLEMNIPTAKEARSTVESGAYQAAKKQAEEISLHILAAIGVGKKSLHGTGWLYPCVKLKLQEKGYKCEAGSQYNEDYWSVSWE